MRVLFVSRTPYSGGHIRMAEIFARRGHETRVLTPAVWEPKLTSLGPRLKYSGRCAWIGDRTIVDEALRWSEVIHFTYSSSLRDLGREDLIGKRVCVWHLATRWKAGFARHFPDGSARHYRFAISCEGWDRYELGPFSWTTLPVLFPLDEPTWTPAFWSDRGRWASISPRLTEDRFRGRPIPAPRGVPQLVEAMRATGTPFRVLAGLAWPRCMRRKACSWVGVDDVVNPLLHLSGFEYLALGVPCLNRRDDRIERALGDLTGAPWPFEDPGESLVEITTTVREALAADEHDWRAQSDEALAWMERYYSADRMAFHYERLWGAA